MGIIKEEINGTKIKNLIKSSNIKSTEYDTESKDLVVEFNNGAKYNYNNVPHQVYTKFRLAESQGKFFTTDIAKQYSYKKV
jgi:hypothetical protein|tara:strand:+ start:368 stop:610 length:243 start_codon:yes stop_codon:yes gene_type:complete